MMKGLLLLCSIVMVACAGPVSPEGTPHAVIAQYYDALRAGRSDNAARLLLTPGAAPGQMYEASSDLAYEIVEEEVVIYSSTKQPGDVVIQTAVMARRTAAAIGTSWFQLFVLRQTPDGWRIVSTRSLAQEDLPPD